MVVAGAGGAAAPGAAGVELRGDARHAAVQGEATGERRLQQLLRVLAPWPGAAVRPVKAAQRHWSRGPRQPMNRSEYHMQMNVEEEFGRGV
uniref:Uncharacterized protein n=1 Tax=Oryza punctata TaxID=4537 RepID=A0A0E0K0T2_ORYPU